MKKFIITVDTEPDGQWDIMAKETTENAKFIPRFQEMCNRYGFKPVYLTDYAMTKDSYFVDIMKRYLREETCEIGMHLHAWDTPPINDFDLKEGNRPYLIEYDRTVMEEKIKTITERLNEVFEVPIVSHRAGRWAIDDRYVELLEKYGYKVDCSVTPHINWNGVTGKSENSKGSNYSKSPESVYQLYNYSVIEIPVTVRKIGRRIAIKNSNKSLRQIAKIALLGEEYWFRPALFSINQMYDLYDVTKDDEYIEMMIHSSELMPGGSPYFPDKESIEELYRTFERLFDLMSKTHEGCTLKEYYEGFVKK